MGVTELIFELQAFKAKIKGVFNMSHPWYGNLLCHKIDSNLFTNDWAVFLIPWFWYQLIYSGYNDPSSSKSWKVVETVLSHLKWVQKVNLQSAVGA